MKKDAAVEESKFATNEEIFATIQENSKPGIAVGVAVN
jgi:hypothetical protein